MQFTLIHGPIIFQVPIQCSLQHQTLLILPDTSTAEHQERNSCFGPAASFLLELLLIALCSSPVAYWTPSSLGASSSNVISFCLFILSMGFSKQEYWSRLLYLSLVDHVLSDLFTVICVSLVTLRGMAHSFTVLPKPLCHNKVVIHAGGKIGKCTKY